MIKRSSQIHFRRASERVKKNTAMVSGSSCSRFRGSSEDRFKKNEILQKKVQIFHSRVLSNVMHRQSGFKKYLLLCEIKFTALQYNPLHGLYTFANDLVAFRFHSEVVLYQNVELLGSGPTKVHPNFQNEFPEVVLLIL